MYCILFKLTLPFKSFVHCRPWCRPVRKCSDTAVTLRNIPPAGMIANGGISSNARGCMRVVWEIPLYRGTVSFLSNNVGERGKGSGALNCFLLSPLRERERQRQRDREADPRFYAGNKRFGEGSWDRLRSQAGPGQGPSIGGLGGGGGSEALRKLTGFQY